MKTTPALFLGLAIALAAFAQAPPAGRFRQPPDPLVSPEVHPDRTVTFRIRAPKAAEVFLTGDWMAAGDRQALAKGADGVWSVTTAPLDATIHLYSFTVDEVTIADPVNPRVKLRQRTSASLVEVPAEPPAVWQMQDVPHGSVEWNWQRSKVLGDTREIFVYLPPGYGRGNARYPVLYLLHGSGDTSAAWTMAGAANLILDNLIAAKRAVPMIVVMPLGHAVQVYPPVQNPGNNTQLFEEYLLKDVMPWAEARYRVAAGRGNRAVAGLSMGGGQSYAVAFSHLDLFSHLGMFSAAGGADFEKRFPALAKAPERISSGLNALWIGCGRQDRLIDAAREFHATLEKLQVTHTYREIEGGHTWPVWRWCLSEFVPLLFRK